MTDADALLSAIIARPDDDLPRLVYADYLDENGDPDRAEFIRVQCELAQLAADDARRPILTERQNELHRANEQRWRLPITPSYPEYHRGFVERLRVPAEQLIAASEKGIAFGPIRTLRVQNADQWVSELAQLPLLSQVEGLELNGNSFGAGGRLSRFLDEARLDRLRYLSLQNNRLWADAFDSLAQSPVARQLTRLDVSGNPFGDEGIERLTTHAEFSNLRELLLSSRDLDFERCIHATGANHLADSPHLSRLTHLDVRGHHIGDAGLIDLARSPHAAALAELDVSHNDIGAIGESAIEELVNSQYLGNLRLLNLGGARNHLNFLAAELLANWPRLADGLIVDLRRCEFGDGAYDTLTASRWADNILLDP